MEGRAQAEAKETAQMYNSLLERDRQISEEMSSYIHGKEYSDLRKREVLHKKWTEKVHEPIRKKLIREMNSKSADFDLIRKHQLHIEYLEYLNRRGHAFLDTYPQDEYFPFRKISTRSNTDMRRRSVADPLLSQQQGRSEEERTILRCQTGHVYSDKDIDDVGLPPLPLVPLGRHGTDCAAWLAMPYRYIESPIRVQARCKMVKNNNASHFKFDDWGKSSDPKLVDTELKIERLKSSGVRPVYIPVKDMIKNHMVIPMNPQTLI